MSWYFAMLPTLLIAFSTSMLIRIVKNILNESTDTQFVEVVNIHDFHIR
ncbi:hypothetical protein ABE142_26480 [Paenibacillus alvei]